MVRVGVDRWVGYSPPTHSLVGEGCGWDGKFLFAHSGGYFVRILYITAELVTQGSKK